MRTALYLAAMTASRFEPTLFLILLLQRRSFEAEVLRESVRELRVTEVSGTGMRGDLVVLGLGTHAIQVVTAQRLPDDLRRFMLHQGDLARRRGSAAA